MRRLVSLLSVLMHSALAYLQNSRTITGEGRDETGPILLQQLQKQTHQIFYKINPNQNFNNSPIFLKRC